MADLEPPVPWYEPREPTHTREKKGPAESWCTHPDRLHAHGSSPWRHAACEREERAWTKINSVAKGKHGA